MAPRTAHAGPERRRTSSVTAGTRLALVDGGAGAAPPWGASPMPAAFQTRGLGRAVIAVPALEPRRAESDAALRPPA